MLHGRHPGNQQPALEQLRHRSQATWPLQKITSTLHNRRQHKADERRKPPAAQIRRRPTRKDDVKVAGYAPGGPCSGAVCTTAPLESFEAFPAPSPNHRRSSRAFRGLHEFCAPFLSVHRCCCTSSTLLTAWRRQPLPAKRQLLWHTCTCRCGKAPACPRGAPRDDGTGDFCRHLRIYHPCPRHTVAPATPEAVLAALSWVDTQHPQIQAPLRGAVAGIACAREWDPATKKWGRLSNENCGEPPPSLTEI